MISPDTLKLWKEAAERATPGPWHTCGRTVTSNQSHPVCELSSEFHRQCEHGTGQDTQFIALSREAVPQLIAEVERLQSGYLTDEHGNEYVQVCILKEKIREQEAEIERLRDALIPFASLGGPNDGMKAFHDLEDDIVIFENSGKSITAGDVRKARASLSPLPRGSTAAHRRGPRRKSRNPLGVV